MKALAENVLECIDLSKAFHRSKQTARNKFLRNFASVFFFRKPQRLRENSNECYWALKDINFSIRRGRSLGIIGLNGSGKTTLLRILAGQLLPDLGGYRYTGQRSAMIDLTAGFDVSKTGRINIGLRALALGWSHSEVKEHTDWIIEFSELGEAIDAPVSTYSSGMKMRLAFSIIIAKVPDLLLIDEVLSVGDFRFKQKCLAQLRLVRERASFVLVSHSMSDVRAFCDEVIVLSQGCEVFRGTPDEAIDVYQSLKFGSPKTKQDRENEILKPQFRNQSAFHEVEAEWVNIDDRPVQSYGPNEPLFLNVAVRPKIDIRRFIIGIPLWTSQGTLVTGYSTVRGASAPSVKSGELVEARLSVPRHYLTGGDYLANLTILDGPEILIRESLPSVSIEPCVREYWGVIDVPQDWSITVSGRRYEFGADI